VDDALAILPWLVIPYDSLTYLLGFDVLSTSQTLPVTALLSLPYLLLRGLRPQMSAAAKAVFRCLLWAFLAMTIITLLNTVAEMATDVHANAELRIPAAMRQGLSMLLGLSTLLMFQDSLARIGEMACMRWAVIGCVPTLVWGMLQLAGGAFRVQGFSSEPSQLADLLVLCLLPACVLSIRSTTVLLVVAGIGLMLLVATFSTTGYIKAMFLVMAVYALRGQITKGLLLILTATIVGYGIISLFPGNYVSLMLSFMQEVYGQTGEFAGGSFIDRFFGFVGPFSQLSGWHAWIGYGFGGDTVYFDSLFSPGVADTIRAVKGDMVSISSLQGKMLMYGGVVGYALYLAGWYRAFVAAPRRHLSRAMIAALFAASLFSLGPIFLPYIWMWLAVAANSATKPDDPHADTEDVIS
jgi:hypothetical protein